MKVQETRTAMVERFPERPATKASKSERARIKIEGIVWSNVLARLDLDTLNATEGSGENPEKCSKEERDEAELKVAEADGALSKAIAVLGKRKNNLEKMG